MEVTLVVPVHMLSLQIPVTLLNMELLREETSTPIVQEVTVMVRDWQEILARLTSIYPPQAGLQG